MPEYLKKAIAYFKNNEIPRDILISVGSALTGALIFDRILRRDQDEEEWVLSLYQVGTPVFFGCLNLSVHIFQKQNIM